MTVTSTETGSPSPPRLPPASSEILSSRRGSLTRLFGGRSSPTGAGHAIGEDNRTAPPLPLGVERDTPRVFDFGPRMSSNYNSLGFSVGGDLGASTGVPLGATISFETSGGTGALLLAKDPIHRHLLRHRGILKAYFLAHREYIHETYGQVEDVDVDEMAFIYGQDCTSDWACAVTLEAERGSKVEFEVFTFLQTGVWGEWKTACSASQRGPHRDRTSEQGERRAVDQTIVVKRLTIQTRRFRAMKMTASAQPRPPPGGCDDGKPKETHENRLQRADFYDPLDTVHEYILAHCQAKYSVASDDDVLALLKMSGSSWGHGELRKRLWQQAERHTAVVVDKDGTASLHFPAHSSHPSPTTALSTMGHHTRQSNKSMSGIQVF